MSQFSFNFSGDDIEESAEGETALPAHASNEDGEGIVVDDRPDQHEAVAVWDLKELLSTLPDRISYYTTRISIPGHTNEIVIPRRALFDVRVQIMAESSSTSDELAREIGLGDSDIEQNVYEGGFKSWEGAMDLARYLSGKMVDDGHDTWASFDSVVELGCGTALPVLSLFRQAMLKSNDRDSTRTLSFTLADYNASVLRLVTLPNMLLTWASCADHNALSHEMDLSQSEGDFSISEVLLEAFAADLAHRNIELKFISGPWSPPLAAQLELRPPTQVLVLAAETIYSPVALKSFMDTLLSILRITTKSLGIVAAKRVYFGVGGSVEEFVSRVHENGGEVREIHMGGSDIDMGVGRCLLEVRA